MQRCPYLHEMKERLLTQSGPDHPFLETVDTEVLEIHPGDGTGVPTIVKVWKSVCKLLLLLFNRTI